MGKSKLVNRLRTVSGHIAAIERMITEDRPCEEILFQMGAVNQAFKKTMIAMYEDGILKCENSEDIKKISTQMMKVM